MGSQSTDELYLEIVALCMIIVVFLISFVIYALIEKYKRNQKNLEIISLIKKSKVAKGQKMI